MSNKKIKYTFEGATQDTTKSKHPFQYYFEAQHIKILATSSQSSSSVTNEKGNEKVITLPTVEISLNSRTISYNDNVDVFTTTELQDTVSENQIIIGHTTTRDSIVIFSTDDNGTDCIWLLGNVLNDEYNLQLLYVRDLNFSIKNPIQPIFNYENENIQKVYWVDGNQQIRSINIMHSSIEGNSNLIDVPSNTIEFVGNVLFSQPVVDNVTSGGTHTAGMIQYAYNLFRLNSAQSRISPLSEIIPLDKGTNSGGGEVNEVVGSTPIVTIDDLDTSYTSIKVYAIKYTSYNEIPSINLIDERDIDGSSVTIYDDGSTISSLSLEEFLLLGSDPLIPKHIESKDNRLFLANIKTKEFILPDELDTRAYSFNSNSLSVIHNNIISTSAGLPSSEESLTVPSSYIVPETYDCVNLDYSTYKYQSDGSTIGGEGKFIKYEIVQKDLTNPEDYRLLKDREIYRIGVEFKNKLGQTSLPKWIADLKVPQGNLEGNYNTLKVEFKPEFYTWLNSYTFDDSSEIIGYKIIRANRTTSDKTILCQGVLGSMMVNSPRDSRNVSLYSLSQRKEDSKVQPKLPNFLMRTFEVITPLQPNSHLLNMQFKNGDPSNQGDTSNINRLTEVQYDGPSGCNTRRKADTYQYTTMYQMYSPEIMFGTTPLSASTKFNVIGGVQNSNNSYWGQERRVSNSVIVTEGKCYNKLTPGAPGPEISLNGSVNNLLDRGLINETNGSDPDRNVEFNQWYRSFSNFYPSSSIVNYSIYRTPEITERGQGNTIYNNDSNFIYRNNLEGFLSDGVQERCNGDGFEDMGTNDRAVVSINSYGAKCVTFVADNGTNDPSIDPHSRLAMEDLWFYAGLSSNTDVALLSELVINPEDIYLSNIYGGNSYEDKKRTTYIKIGEYKDINDTFVQIDNAGDTYVQDFKFLRIGKTDVEVYSAGVNQMSEVVSVKVETAIDLKNRNDLSISDWEANFQPKYDDYHKYNNVYSQQPTLVQTEDVDYTFRRIENFDTKIQATSLKTPNESIDSWTNILTNETQYLDGKYGPINGLINYEDKMFAFQDEAVASISINPRVQVQADDGISIELGTGGVLYDYNYITTKSGCINKWGIIRTKKGIYYYDALNKGVARIPDAIKVLLSDYKGFHSFFNNNYNYSFIKQDNPILGSGVIFGYDNYNNDVYFTILQGDKSFTWCYNELKDDFIDLKTYTPSRYINKGEKLLLPNTDNNELWEQYAGDYNNFFGKLESSFVILQLNPESDYDCVFNNIHYNSEIYLNDIDQPDKTLTHIQAYNEYQDTGRIPLIVGRGSNIRRKFREWQADIPREGRNRIRNPWIFLKLELENKDNFRMILHDIIVSYNV